MLSNLHIFPNQHHFWSSAEDDLYFPKFDFHQQNASFLPFPIAACGSSLTSAGLSTSALLSHLPLYQQLSNLRCSQNHISFGEHPQVQPPYVYKYMAMLSCTPLRFIH